MYRSFCAAVGFADVTSANVVGYNTIGLRTGAGKFSSISVPFVHVADNKGAMPSQDLAFTGLNDGGGYPTLADQLWMWNGIGYDIYYWYVGSGAYMDETGWWNTAGSLDLFERDHSEGLFYGAPLMFKAIDGATKTMTSSGAVDSAPEVGKPILNNAFTDVANPYPTALHPSYPSEFLLENANDGGGYPTLADQLWVWNGVGYDIYYWYVGSGAEYDETGWWNTAGSLDLFERDFKNGIPAGEGFMIKAVGGSTEKEAVFYSPLAK